MSLDGSAEALILINNIEMNRSHFDLRMLVIWLYRDSCQTCSIAAIIAVQVQTMLHVLCDETEVAELELKVTSWPPKGR
jgi:hypothetical protein